MLLLDVEFNQLRNHETNTPTNGGALPNVPACQVDKWRVNYLHSKIIRGNA